MKIDLHCHSTASDGVFAPAELVARAHEQGVEALALTDHDTLEGLAEAKTAAQTLGMYFVNGVELSCQWGGATIHVLGYGFSYDAEPLVKAINAVHQGRWQRAQLIDERLAAKGMSGSLEGARRIQQSLGESLNAPARPHFADYLVEQGFVRDRAEAFRKWLGSGKLGDVKQHWPELDACVKTLRESGAWVSLAHPLHYDFTRSKRRRLVTDFVAAGGQALEVVNGMQAHEQTGTLAILTREFGLKATAGSDFHGPSDWNEIGRFRPLPDDLAPLAAEFAPLAVSTGQL